MFFFLIRKLTLQKMKWNIFEPENFDSGLPSFLTAIKKELPGEVIIIIIIAWICIHSKIM